MNQQSNCYAIVGGTLWGNRGAEAMVVTSIGEMRARDPAATFLLFSYLPQADRRLNRDPNVTVFDATPRVALLVHVPLALLCWLLSKIGVTLPSWALPRSLRWMRGCRALLDVSGISFHDGRLAVVAYNIVCLWPALLLGVPVFRMSQACGPFNHPLNRLPARWITRAAQHTFARGSGTAEHLRHLRVPADRWSIAADVAFAYDETYTLTSENDAQVRAVRDTIRTQQAAGRRTIALVPSSLVMQKAASHGHDYVQVLHEVIKNEASQGFHVLVLPNATRAIEAGLRNNDIAVIRLLRERLDAGLDRVDPSSVTLVDFDLNTAAIRQLLSSCAVVVTSRFHAMIAGLAVGVPSLALGWSHKYLEVLEMFGLERDALPYDVATERLIARIDEMIEGECGRRARIADAWPDILASSRSQFDIVMDALPAR